VVGSGRERKGRGEEGDKERGRDETKGRVRESGSEGDERGREG